MIEKFIKHFAMRDALLRSTALVSSIFTVAAISLLPGFGVKGLGIAISIQLILSAFLELPTSMLADRYGRSFVLKISLSLKILVTAMLGLSIYFAYLGKSNYVWLVFCLEAILDAISNTLLSGTYQVAYLDLYNKIKIPETEERPLLFLKSYKYGLAYRIILPVSFIILISSLFYSLGRNNYGIYYLASSILLAILCLRFLIWKLVSNDFKDIKRSEDRSKHSLKKGFFEVLDSIKKSKSTLLIYSISSLFNFVSILYVSGQTVKLLPKIFKGNELIWLLAISVNIFIYLIRTLTLVFIGPRISNNSFGKLVPFFGLLIILGSAVFMGYDQFINDKIYSLVFLIFFSVVLFVSSDAFTRSIESSMKELVATDYKATWLSIGNTIAYSILGITSVIATKYFFTLSNFLIGLLLFISGIIIIIVHLMIKKNTLTFSEILNTQLIKLLLITIAAFLLVDISSYLYNVNSKFQDTKNSINKAIFIGSKSSILKGDVVETRGFLHSLKVANQIKCYQLNLPSMQFDDCKIENSDIKNLVRDNLLLSYDNNSYGEIIVYHDLSYLDKNLYDRILLDIIASLFVYAVLYYIFSVFSGSLTKEVILLNNLISVEFHNDQHNSLHIKEFKDLYEHAKESAKLKEKFNIQNALIKLSTQTAHDIRSPLEVLKSLRNETSGMSEDSRKVFLMSINRIEEIASNLLKKNKHTDAPTDELSPQELLSSLETILLEKKVEFSSISNIEFKTDFNNDTYGLFSKINRSDLKRIISNLINNAIEAIGDQEGKVCVQLLDNTEWNIIEVSDNGPGIPKEHHGKIFSRGFTSKQTGNGLGLSGALDKITSWDGKIEFDTKLGEGTTFKIHLPQIKAPDNFVKSLDVYKYAKVIIVDDEQGIHEIWKRKLSSILDKVEFYFSSRELFKNYPDLPERTLLLSDLDIVGDDIDGIDVIKKSNHIEDCILITARSEEHSIQKKCSDLGIKILPKSVLNYVKVNTETPSVILIDDDKLIRLNWKMHFENKGIHFKSFSSIEQFLNESTIIDKNSSVYIDVNLGNGIRGEIESEKIFKLGFKNLYLATGYQKEDLDKPAWIKEIYSKSPPV